MRITSHLVRGFAALALVGGTTFAAVAPSQAMIPVPEGTVTCVNSFGNPNTCAEAVTWAKNHRTGPDNPNPAYTNMCDHIAGLEYGWAHSGSTTAYVHWTQIPSTRRYPGDRTVPAGGLAFFSNGGAGHVMISIGGGTFVSNDIHGNGTLTNTTIAEIENKWGAHYLGWAQPWFQANH
ncbi:hypothetical protein ASD62_16420 [Phycicoccus sp. Root563]|uniref:hypothetical protein n=1 Tax=Phycicoccus sp. Root563 TaxID=1736562 RepID=UPI000702FA91|nr:hypothetical protein [Phycicoccus sp. Root563]KQZ90633.1 hypothetical protein ASD62_16420 [Phycicoccus sp. Root563]